MTKELNQLLNALKIDKKSLTDKQIAKAEITLDKMLKDSYVKGGDDAAYNILDIYDHTI